MSLPKMPIDIVSFLVELLDAEDVFNVALTCKALRYILYDRRMCRIALLKVPYSTEAQEAQSTKNFPKAFRKLAKRRMAVQSAKPWKVAIVAMADHFIYTNGHLCYTVNSKHLRVLDTLRKKPTSELTVNVALLLKDAVRDYDPQRPHTFKPLYYAEGVVSCLATQVLEDSTTCSWLLIFELRESPRWIVVQRPDTRYPSFVRNDKNYLFWGSKSHAILDGSHKWNLRCLNLQTRKWADSHLILWDFEGVNIGSNICFEIIDGHFYCVSNSFKTEANNGTRNHFYQVVRFPAIHASHDKCEKPPMRSLWRHHDSDGAVDERWTSLQLTKDEKTGELFIVETRKEWITGNAGSQRTCYKKKLQFDQQEKEPQRGPFFPTPPESTVDTPEDEWSGEEHTEERSREQIHVGDGPTDAKIYTLQECFVRSYNPSCNAFIDLISDSKLQLRVRSKQELTVSIWPEGQESCHHDNVLAQLQGIVNIIQPIREIEWSMDERILVYSPVHMACGQLRPIILISFDSGLYLPGFPNYLSQTGDSNGHSDAAPILKASGGSKGVPWSTNQDIDESVSPGERDPEACTSFVRSRPPLYQTMSMGNGNAHGLDLSYPRR